jgi:putative sterol carrier protein
MNATDEDWACMGKGSFGCGAMGAMMTGKFKFSGPKGEAMSVMGPFDSFLQLTGKVPGDTSSCQK